MAEKSAKRGPTRGLTAASIKAMKPEPKRYEVPDHGCPGLTLRIHPSGAKVFVWAVNSLGMRITLGVWSETETAGCLTLEQAHHEMATFRKIRHSGRARPGAAPEAVEAARTTARARLAEAAAALKLKLHPPPPAPADVVTVARVADEFYKRRIEPHRRRPEAAKRVLDLDIIPQIGQRPIEALTTREVAKVIEKVVDRGAKVHAGKVLALVKQLMRFAESRGYTDRNVAASLDPKDLGVEANVRQRALSEEEIAPFWRALDKEYSAPKETVRRDPRPGREHEEYAQRRVGLSATVQAALKILLLVGTRAGELLQAAWSEVDLVKGLWTIPPSHTKYTKAQMMRARPFIVPLSPGALAQFKVLREIADKLGDGPEERKAKAFVLASAESTTGRLTDKALGLALRRLFARREIELPGGPCTVHDLRRTLRSRLGRLRVPLHVVERCLNHSLGRIVQTYDVNDYLDERREALALWDAYISRLVTGKGAQVVPMPNTAGGAR